MAGEGSTADGDRGAAAQEDGCVRVRDSDGVRTLILDRPARRNALTVAMYETLAEALETLDARDDLRVGLLTATGGTFCAGNDLGDFLEVSASGEPLGADSPQGRLLHALARREKPLVAAVDGAGIGIGFTALLHADLVVATPTASFGAPFVPLGLCPEAGSSLLLPALLGRQRAMEVFLLGRRLDAAEAHEAGLLNRVVASEDLVSVARGYAESLAALPPHAVRATRRLVCASPEPLAERIDRELAAFGECLSDERTRTALAAARAATTGREPAGPTGG